MNHQKKFDFFTLVHFITLFSSYLSHATEHVPGLKYQLKIHSKLVEVSVLKVFFLKIFFLFNFWAKKGLKIILKRLLVFSFRLMYFL